MTRKETQDLAKAKKELLVLVGSRIKEIRISKGFSQVDLASRIPGNFDTTNVSRIESGRTNCTLFTLLKIAQALEVEINDLLV